MALQGGHGSTAAPAEPCPPACSIPGHLSCISITSLAAQETPRLPKVRSGTEQVNPAPATLQKIQLRTEACIFPCLMLEASRGPICLTFFFLSGNSIYWRLSPVTVQRQKLCFIENTFRLGMQAKSTLMEQHRLGTVREKCILSS